jgi:hypothetical protein
VDLSNFTRDLEKLSTADAVVADSYLRYALRKSALYLLACCLAMVSLGLLGLSLYWALEHSVGAIGAAALVGFIGCQLATIVAVLAAVQSPGREFSFAIKVRKSAVQSLEQDLTATSPGNVAHFYSANEALITSLVLHLMRALIGALRTSRVNAVEPPAAVSGNERVTEERKS